MRRAFGFTGYGFGARGDAAPPAPPPPPPPPAPSTAGPNSPATFADLGDGPVWLDVSNVASSNNSYATCTVDTFGTSGTLRARNFGFAIPGGATITRIKAEVEAASDAISPSVYVAGISLAIHNVGNVDDQIASATPGIADLTVTDAYYSVDQTQAAWGTSLTVAQVNAATFAVDVTFAEDGNGSAQTVSVDHIRVTITYTE